MKKKKNILIFMSVILIPIGVFIAIFLINNKNLVCTRENIYEKETFYLSFNFFGNLKSELYENSLYYENEKDAKKYYNDMIKEKDLWGNKIEINGKIITVFSNDRGVVIDKDESKYITNIKRIYQEQGYSCKEVKK